jgi:hypothetical protein
MFRRNTSLPSAGSKSKTCKKPAETGGLVLVLFTFARCEALTLVTMKVVFFFIHVSLWFIYNAFSNARRSVSYIASIADC